MDFRTCPACKASVLEDDVADCPFCGASMTTGKPSGKGQAAASKPAAAKPTAAAPAPAGKPPAKAKPTSKGASRGESDGGDPFDVDTSAARKAIPVKAKPAKGYMIRIACPMCERPGFISEAEVGKEVKCCNPECLVPVFVANPPREKAPEPEPEPTGGGKLWLFGGVGLVAAGIVAAVLVLNRKPPEPAGPLTPSAGIERPNGGDPVTPPPGTGDPVVPAPVAALTPREIITQSIAGLQSASERAENARERALATRVLAESLMLSGEAAKGRQQLANLTGASQYAAVGPLVLEAWKQLAAGNDAAAKGAIEEAWKLKDLLPKRGREALDMGSNLAAALAAVGRMEDAQALAAVENDPDAGEYSAQWRAAVDGGAYRFDLVVQRSCLREVAHPAWVSVTQSLAGRGRLEEARQWALAAPDLVVRDDCLAVIAAQAASQSGQTPELTAKLQAWTAALEPAGQARIWSAVGQGLLERGDQANAKAAAALAMQAVQSIAAGPPLTVPEMKALYDLADTSGRGLPVPLAARSAALAAFDVYELQSRLGDQAAAWPMVERALQLLRPVAPSAKATAALTAQLESSGAAVRRDLAAALMVDDSVIVSRFSKYQAQVRAWHERALQRRDLEARFLRRAILHGDVAAAWKLMQSAESEPDPGLSQSYFDTPLPALVRQRAMDLKLPDLPAEIEAAYKPLKFDPPPATPTDLTLARLALPAPSGDWKPLLLALEQFYMKPPEDRALVDAATVSLVLQTLEQDPKGAITLAGQLPDTLLREDSLWLCGARGTLTDRARTVLAEFKPRNFASQGPVLSFYRGCVDAAARMP